MSTVYLDNAATTPIRPEVITNMSQYMTDYCGNPSATHSFGRSVKSALEMARKTVASHLNASSNEIVFTSGATESIHWIINSCIANGVQRIISSKIEHHAVLDTIQHTQKEVTVDYVALDEFGAILLTDLVLLLQNNNVPTLVCLMHANNETGTISDLEKIGRICQQHNALLMSDTVQTMGKLPMDVAQMGVDFLVASAHKFHGPKGVGFVYKKKNRFLIPLFNGGGQEKGLRAGTENVHSILGMADALTISYQNIEAEQKHLKNIKDYAIKELLLHFPDIKFNGDLTQTANHIINMVVPLAEKKASMIVFILDMKGVAISRGSACQSGSDQPSHVLKEILNVADLKKPSIRISFSYQTQLSDIDILIEALKSIS